MLPSQFRLKLPPRWNRNFPDHKVSTKLFKLVSKKVDGQTGPRIGFIISTKVGKATVRNRLRRKLETLLLPTFKNSNAPVDLILIAYPTLSSANDEELSLNINQALSKIHLQ